MRMLMTMVLGLLAIPALAQTAPAPAPTPAPSPTPAAAPLPRVAIDTTEGRIVVEVEIKRAPVSAANFLRYVDAKRLDGITFYRTSHVAERFGFVQFGVNGDPKLVFPPIKHEPTSQTGIKHLEGTLSLPRFGPGTARGDFTISIGDQPSFDADPARDPGTTRLDLGYAAFGRVVDGMDVVMKIFSAPISPTATLRGSFRGEIPVKPVRIITARRVKA
jgi:peptidyl-prolyl cis-trans isomerase A (cyclophilin A)